MFHFFACPLLIAALIFVLVPAAWAQQSTGTPTTPVELSMEYEFDEALAKARQRNQPLLAIITHPSSPGCALLFDKILSDSAVQSFLKDNFVVLDLPANSRRAAKLHSDLALGGLPAFVVFDDLGSPNGKQCGMPNNPPGFIDAMRLLKQGGASIVSSETGAVSKNPNYHRGNELSHKGDFDGAIQSFSQAVSEEPTCWEAYNNRGIVYYNRKDYDKALADFTEVIKLNPKLSAAYINRGNILDDTGKQPEAIVAYSKAVELDPTEPEGYFNRAIAEKHLGQIDQARSDLLTASKLYRKRNDIVHATEAEMQLNSLK